MRFYVDDADYVDDDEKDLYQSKVGSLTYGMQADTRTAPTPHAPEVSVPKQPTRVTWLGVLGKTAA